MSSLGVNLRAIQPRQHASVKFLYNLRMNLFIRVITHIKYRVGKVQKNLLFGKDYWILKNKEGNKW